ncbi:translation initiation factor IF-2, mitochondrial [Nymphalis io]|uniref:translation initiation factor IF-2, mitochondrial n=1 Tax=Inachis io TaxID=171585 RepID=UPI00216A87AB|nr:translation initiation factor IF-2, mitochondrial [Nymphalis io]
MFRSVILKNWLPLKHLKNEYFLQAAEARKDYTKILWNNKRQLSVSSISLKKRKTSEEKAVENRGKRVIRYSPKAGTEVVGIWRNMTVQEIANVLKKDVDHVFKALEFADKNTDTYYKEDTVIHNPQIIRDVVKISGCRFRIIARPDDDIEKEENKDAVPAPPAPPEALRPRPPVVCVMGHVDHGKTTLLDALRDTSVVDTEFGGITQHIGAFEVTLPSGEKATFLDTPGHAAFSAMRSRGALATDVVVLVVAADDGVMAQTIESVRMARHAGVPILVAINKIEKPGVNIDKTLRSLAQVGVVCEALGGDVQAVGVSALRRLQLGALLDALDLQAQLADLRADPTGYVEGVVLEALVDPRTGKQATVLVQRGTLRKGCVIVAGNGWAKVRMLQNSAGLSVESASPATPVLVLGWRELPAAGDTVLEVESEKRASEVMRWRHNQRMKEKQESDLEAINIKESEHQAVYKQKLAQKRSLGRFRTRQEGPRQKMIRADTHPALAVLVKGDVDGSVEAILDILETYDDHERVRLELVSYGVGQVTPNDVEVAKAFNAIIYAFNVECPPAVSREARAAGVSVSHHNVIYKLVDDLRAQLSARLPTELHEELLGEANVLQQFHVSEGKKKVPVAGCRCVKGSLARNALYRVVRGGDVVYEGKLASMKHLKEEVTTIKRDMECGLRFEDPNFIIQPGDTVVCYKMVEVSKTTSWDPGF